MAALPGSGHQKMNIDGFKPNRVQPKACCLVHILLPWKSKIIISEDICYLPWPGGTENRIVIFWPDAYFTSDRHIGSKLVCTLINP